MIDAPSCEVTFDQPSPTRLRQVAVILPTGVTVPLYPGGDHAVRVGEVLGIAGGRGGPESAPTFVAGRFGTATQPC